MLHDFVQKNTPFLVHAFFSSRLLKIATSAEQLSNLLAKRADSHCHSWFRSIEMLGVQPGAGEG